MTGLLHSTPRSIALLLAGCALLVWALVPAVTGKGALKAQAQVDFVCDLSFTVDAPREIDAAPGDQFSYGFLASITVYEVMSINLSVSPGSAPGLIVSSSPAQTSIQVQEPPVQTTYDVPGTISIGVPFDAAGGSYLVSGINASAVCQAVGGGTGNTSAPGSTIQVNVIEPTPTPIATDTPTPTATATDIPTPTATNTALPTPTDTATSTATSTATTPPSPTPTSTSTSTATATSPPNATNTSTPTSTSTASATSPNAPTPTSSATASPPATSTSTSTPTSTPPGTPPSPPIGGPTSTGTITATPSGTVTATASGTATNPDGSPTASVTGTRSTAPATSTDDGSTEEPDDDGVPGSTSTPEVEVESAASSLVLDFTEERAVVLAEDGEDRSWFQIGAGLLGLALVVGGGYGVWRGRERGL